MSANTLDEVLKNDRVSLNAAILKEEVEVRERIIEMKKAAYENKEKRRVKDEKEAHKISQEERLAAAYKASNIVVGDCLDSDEEVTKNTFYERFELLKQKSEFMDNEIKKAQENCDMQIFSFNNACKILFQLRRLETCCAKMEKWVEQNYTDEYDATQAEMDLAEEQMIAEHIRNLLDRRDEELGRIEVVMNKIQTASETLKRGFQVDKTITPDGQFTEGALSYERNVCREDGANYDVENIFDRSEFISRGTKDRLRRFRRERNELYYKNKALKATIKHDSIILESDKTRLEHRALVDSCADGIITSAVFRSTLNTLTHQLELEQEICSQPEENQYSQFAIADRANNDTQMRNNLASPTPRSPYV